MCCLHVLRLTAGDEQIVDKQTDGAIFTPLLLFCFLEPIPAFSPLQRESMDREEARLSPHAGGRLIRQLLEEDSDPMLSPRFYAYGQCQQYLDDTEVPPSPPNAHSFVR